VRPPAADDATVIRNAVIHLTNEQPLLADLFDEPKPTDNQLVCTNLRSVNGKRPVFVDDKDSTFVFPLAQIRFVEIPGTGRRAIEPRHKEAGASPSANGSGDSTNDLDLELDEEFLRRVREA
jgi:hypothetical protein